jgi:hypothetical protein
MLFSLGYENRVFEPSLSLDGIIEPQNVMTFHWLTLYYGLAKVTVEKQQILDRRPQDSKMSKGGRRRPSHWLSYDDIRKKTRGNDGYFF